MSDDDCTCQGFKRDFRCPVHGDGIFTRTEFDARPSALAQDLRLTPEQCDEYIKLLDAEVKRGSEYIESIRARSSSGFVMSMQKKVKTFEEIRELIRKLRQQIQMTGMTGGRIE